ncbi:MAG: ATP-binding protein, partial [Gammaproteobacteria bacterium]|nr:ATP-binding protein [Gammaproteobacteria bacterium]
MRQIFLDSLRYSLKYRIAVIIFVLEAIMITTVLGVTLTHSTEKSRQQSTKTEEVMLNLLADLSMIALLTAEYDEIQPYIEEVVADPRIQTVFLANHTDKVVVSSNYSLIGKPVPQLLDEDLTHWRSLILHNSNGKLGTIAMQFSVKELIESSQETLNLGLLIAFSGMIAIAIIGVVIGFLLTRRLEVLKLSAQKIAQGDLDVRTGFYGKDEVSVVGQAFDKMAENVSKNLYALQKATDLLEDRVEERTRELAIARDEAINATRTKSSFLANMSHEIRTPLTAIIGYSESMLENDMSPSEQIDSLSTVIRSSKHLLNIINDILDLSKVEADKLEVELIPLSPFDLMNEVRSLITLLAEEKGLLFSIDYDLPIPETISGDPLRLKQILLNLANNAIKFTHQGSIRIEVSCDCSNEQMTFKVMDTGIGMNKEQIEKLFIPFSQADTSTSREYGGTGLGLHLSKQLAEKMGGDITLESATNVGSKFELRIRTGSLQNVKMITEVPIYKEQPENNKSINTHLNGKVLLAEDNQDNQRLVSMLIRQCGVEVDIASNGREAVDMALANPYDLILMDMQMPVMSGKEAVIALRSKAYKGTIVALTANAMKK